MGGSAVPSGAAGAAGTTGAAGAAGAAGTTGAAGAGAGGTGGAMACAGDPLTRCTGTMSGPWCMETVPGDSNTGFVGLWANRPDDVWLVGGVVVPGPDTFSAAYARFDGCTWTLSLRPDLPQVWGVWGAAANDVWIVGDGPNTYHWNGSALTPVPIPGATIVSSLFAVSGTSGTDVWAAGPSGIFHWNGSAWAQSSTSFGNDVWAVAPNDVWVAGVSTALHFNGTWTGTPLTSSGLFTIWGDGTQAYAGGGGEQLFHFTGGSWTTLQVSGDGSRGFNDIGGLGADIFTVGNSKVVRLSGATFAPVTDVPTNLYSNVWVSPTQVWLSTVERVVARRAR